MTTPTYHPSTGWSESVSYHLSMHIVCKDGTSFDYFVTGIEATTVDKALREFEQNTDFINQYQVTHIIPLNCHPITLVK